MPGPPTTSELPRPKKHRLLLDNVGGATKRIRLDDAGSAAGTTEKLGQSFLQHLPRELRDQIYDYAFGPEHLVFHRHDSGLHICLERPEYFGIKSHLPAWIRTNKQICSEAVDVLSRTRIFSIHTIRSEAHDSKKSPLIFNPTMLRNVRIQISSAGARFGRGLNKLLWTISENSSRASTVEITWWAYRDVGYIDYVLESINSLKQECWGVFAKVEILITCTFKMDDVLLQLIKQFASRLVSKEGERSNVQETQGSFLEGTSNTRRRFSIIGQRDV
ncbi:hypothetical protein ACN47E_000060 [Coniothyrium glycines]